MRNTVLVTGSAGLIGSETARVLGAAGAQVVATDLPGTGVDKVAAELRDTGPDAAQARELGVVARRHEGRGGGLQV